MEPEFHEPIVFSKKDILEAFIIVLGGIVSSMSVLILLFLAVASKWIFLSLFTIGVLIVYSLKKAQ